MDAIPISQQSQSQRVLNATAAGTTNVNTTAVDMADAQGVAFVVAFGAITASAVTGVKLQQSSDNGSSDDFTDIAGSAQAVTDTDDNQIVEVDVFRPLKRYVRLVITRGTANAVIDSVTARKYNLDVSPLAKHSTSVGTKLLIGAAEGTA